MGRGVEGGGRGQEIIGRCSGMGRVRREQCDATDGITTEVRGEGLFPHGAREGDAECRI